MAKTTSTCDTDTDTTTTTSPDTNSSNSLDTQRSVKQLLGDGSSSSSSSDDQIANEDDDDDDEDDTDENNVTFSLVAADQPPAVELELAVAVKDKAEATCRWPMAKLVSAANKLRGLFFAILAAFLLSLSKVVIKKAPHLLGSDHSFIRYVLQFALPALAILHRHNKQIKTAKRAKSDAIGAMLGPDKPELRNLLRLRGILGAVGMLFLHFAITFIAPSDTVAISHCSLVCAYYR